jgi:hypothetical protein
MKWQFRLFSTIAILGATSAAVAQTPTEPKTDLTGRWSYSVVYEGGSGSPTVTMTQKGDSLFGRYISQAFGEIDLRGTIKEKDFTFYVTTSAGGDPFTMTFEGKVEGPDLVKGAVDLGGNGTATFTGTRQKPPAPAPFR